MAHSNKVSRLFSFTQKLKNKFKKPDDRWKLGKMHGLYR